jgi:hypothetical protein
MERLFPEIGAAYFGSLSIGPVEEIARRLLRVTISDNMEDDAQTPLTLMEYPIDTVNAFRSRMGWVQPVRTPSFPQFNPPNFYMSEPAPMAMPPTTSEYLPYGDNPAFSYSTEDLSVMTTDSGPSSALSPLQLSSPFPSQQYLSIPSPSYGGYSPASSTFGDFGDASSVAYSDNEDYGSYDNGSYDMGFASTNPVLGGSNNFGGFVTPIQTVWI